MYEFIKLVQIKIKKSFLIKRLYFSYFKGAVIVANQEECHFSHKYWDTPEQFNPENFIDENGKLKTKIDGFLPFSIGKQMHIRLYGGLRTLVS